VVKGARQLVLSPMPDLVDTIRNEIDARLEELRPFAREASDLQRALDALSELPVVLTADGRGRRRRSNRRLAARARSPRGDTRARVIEFIASNPGSTAGDVARALGLNRNSVATRLAQLAKSGELAKAQRGYSAP
jgi:Winged helix-turn-helix DNA-binding